MADAPNSSDEEPSPARNVPRSPAAHKPDIAAAALPEQDEDALEPSSSAAPPAAGSAQADKLESGFKELRIEDILAAPQSYGACVCLSQARRAAARPLDASEGLTTAANRYCALCHRCRFSRPEDRDTSYRHSKRR